MLKRDHCVSAKETSIVLNTTNCTIAGITTNICIALNLPSIKKSVFIHSSTSLGVASWFSEMVFPTELGIALVCWVPWCYPIITRLVLKKVLLILGSLSNKMFLTSDLFF